MKHFGVKRKYKSDSDATPRLEYTAESLCLLPEELLLELRLVKKL
jgi:hypothetical protein